MRCPAAAGLRHGLQQQVQPVVARPFLSSSPASNLCRYASARRRGSAHPNRLPIRSYGSSTPQPRPPHQPLTTTTASPPRHHATRYAALQAICDRLGPGTINVFTQRWLHRLPLPFTTRDRDAGYWWETSMRQVEISRTIVFDAPRHARGFFEALVADNLDIGRPHNVEIIFARKIRRDTRGRRDNGGVLVNVSCKHSRIKQYLKDGKAMRIETVVNAPRDLGCNARLPNLDELQAKARAANRRILETERAGQGTVLASPAFERVAHPCADAEGRRTPALRFGDPRVMALAGALCQTLLAATGFTSKNLRVLIAGLLGSACTPGQMTYDLRRLRLNGLIRRLPHTNRYTLTEDGIRIAVFYTKVYNRLLVPLTAANQPQAPPDLRAALAAITRHVNDYASRARLPAPRET